MSSQETVLRLRLLPDGRLEYEDWRGNTRTCQTSELGARAQAILSDPNLPPVEVVNPGATRVAEFYVRALLPPELRHLAPTGVTALENVMRGIQRLREQRPAAPSHQQAQANPRPPEPPEPPPRRAHRRGRRVA
jgi:hypothetical protein